MCDMIQTVRSVYKQYGQSKNIDLDNDDCYFLQRNFIGEQDLLIIFNSGVCTHHCKFCTLWKRQPYLIAKSISEQFMYVVSEMRHSLSVLDRVTLSNNGSMLNENEVDKQELMNILLSLQEIKNIYKYVIETDLRFVNNETIKYFQPFIENNRRIDILTGFETFTESIRNNILGKSISISEFERRLDVLAKGGFDMTAYLLFKPVQDMSDDDALNEAILSAEYLITQTKQRGINLTIRINPMFAARDSEWANIAEKTSNYQPPKLSDILQLAQKLNDTVPTYIGLSTESKSELWGSYRTREDFSKELLLTAIKFNNHRG